MAQQMSKDYQDKWKRYMTTLFEECEMSGEENETFKSSQMKKIESLDSQLFADLK